MLRIILAAIELMNARHLYKQSVLFSELVAGNIPAGINTLIIDNIGMLSRLYHYATIAYVGGGFGDDGVIMYWKPQYMESR